MVILSRKDANRAMNLKGKITGNSRKSEMLRFCIVGGFATVLQYVIYIACVSGLGVSAEASTLISYAVSFVFNFVLSTFFTFHTHPTAKKGVGFTLSHLVNMGLQTVMVAIFEDITGPELALLPAMAISVPVNYMLVRYALTSRRFLSEREKASRRSDRA